ncbi:holo-ACP synthase [Desulfuromonas versatilis]|uniref:holo-ACP synthase n=1 Tax=Desulfuromonas versatilis TaxID=2802975 RepID=UPI00298F57FE|nr:holo-ACP synthase [Desulfuromonas versatilis]
MAGIGIDLARVERFRRFLAEGKAGVIDRIFTAGEKAYSLGKKDPAPHLAVRFAAKEAFLKALGLGLREGISWQDMEVVRDELGAPSLRLTGRAAEIFAERGLSALHLSYSHDGDYGVANVVLEKP